MKFSAKELRANVLRLHARTDLPPNATATIAHWADDDYLLVDEADKATVIAFVNKLVEHDLWDTAQPEPQPVEAAQPPAPAPEAASGPKAEAKAKAKAKPSKAAVAPSGETAGITNAEFAVAIFGALTEGHQIAITSFADMTAPNWNARRVAPADVPDQPTLNSYFCVSSLLPGKPRDAEHFAALAVLVLDDLTPEALAVLPPPTYAIETSAGNHQAGYKLAEPMTDLPKAQALHAALQRAGYCDSNGNNPVRWVRLPVGKNTKPDKMFEHVLRAWVPGRTFTPEALVSSLGLKLEAPPGTEAPATDDFSLRATPSAQQLADARLMIAEARSKRLHADKGHEKLWHRIALALCMVPGGSELFIEFSEGGLNYSKAACEAKLTEKRRAIEKNPARETGMVGFFKAMADAGIANPAAGRKATATQTPEAVMALTVGNSADPATNLARNLFANLTLTEKEANKMVEAEFWIPSMVVRGHILAYPARSGGGKTTLFVHFCEEMARAGADIYYINVDSPPDMLKWQQAHAARHGYSLVTPDSFVGKSIADAVVALETLADSPVRLDKLVLILDTLKKFISVLNKEAASKFYTLLRRISVKGATVCLLSHTNKYLTTEGELIYEGTGDQRTDIDDMIYIYASDDKDARVVDLTTKPDKVRAVFKPRSFRIHLDEARRVEECAELLPIINKDERLVLKLATSLIRGGVTVQRTVVERLMEETPFGRDKLRSILFNLSDGDIAPLIARREQLNNTLRYAMRGEHQAYADFDDADPPTP